MLGVGWTEMLVIGVVALIVIGPKELPALMQKLGRFTATVRRMGADFQRELNRTTGLDEVKNLRDAIAQPLRQTTDAIRREFNTTTPSGTVKPSGALKPADPKAESVVSEIHKAAGMAPVGAEPGKAGAAASAPIEPAPDTVAAPVAEPATAAPVTAATVVAPSTASPPATSPAPV
ncbi:MAG TPA: twin-arginine translocase subunit TatB, partial [Alphaproteobacteria bacterium]|nr:twin-arginine translocase subunit TatB [Alphaproteobacteria bacterium]